MTKTRNLTPEDVRLEESLSRQNHWKRWGPYFRSVSGARFAKITAQAAPLGIFFHTTMPARALIAGERTGSLESPIAIR